ncbi:NAD(P)-binding domain-containing protein [Nordella sp. HKS 07]|uniref:flavin-containing monooxygenase n=1 Tax=Nordella sp. HKS 07 TaxID=2712222 RepID=UPI0013E1BDA9|nr:NAD(P)/FAD-dependent oxidoreductase [Nordella sp. HKS 07]QIG47164.1 NAD(P)-binding domain-containing protein [Nordella sp. HKS 07]
MYATDVAIVGAGQAGLAMSRCLSVLGVDHVLFERGAVGARWRTHVWESLRLLTPNWLNGLPDSPYQGDDPDGFMRHGDFLARLEAYADMIGAPVMSDTEVLSLAREPEGFCLTTSRGTWRSRAVVVATGQCDLPRLPDHSSVKGVLNLHSSQYRTPHGLPQGGVLVVGASASGVQIADEISRSGRQVTLAVGRHMRVPRHWRGRDIFWWMDRLGILAERTHSLADPEAALREPVVQLAGRPDRSNADLPSLQALGVRLAGRFAGVEAGKVSFHDDLAESVACAEAKLYRLLARFDDFAGIGPNAPRQTIAPVTFEAQAPRRLSLRGENIRSIIWATGYRRDFGWLKIAAALRPDGDLAHQEGAATVPGLFALGFRLLRKRDSHFIGGVGADAAVIARQIRAFLDERAWRAA